MTEIPLDLVELYSNPSPPRSGDARQQIAWLKLKAAQIALDDAIADAFRNEPPDPVLPPYADTMLLVCDMQRRLGWPADRANAALSASWAEAQAKAADILNRVERRVRALAYERADGERIIGEATKIANVPPAFVPEQLLVACCQRVALATVRTGHARRAG